MKYSIKEITEEIVRQLMNDYDENALAVEFKKHEHRGFVAENREAVNQLISEGMSLEDAVSYIIEMDLL